ncbi:MAG: hypothetical protein EHM70_08025 [Chloroflexota bacterium]|nr:MAG: hypothetical protein EHM70_08025 [Chloroflexota bacterium]
MEKRAVTTGDQAHVILTVHGNLRLKGDDENEVVAKADSPEDLTVDQQGDEVHIRCTSDCSVRVPYGARITVEAVHGDASLKGSEGELYVQHVHGNLNLRSMGQCKVDMVDGDLEIKHIAGDCVLQTVNGNASVRDVEGSFSVTGAINGNLKLDDVEDEASAMVNGNATLRLDPRLGQAYNFSANGNLLCRLPEDASVKLSVPRAASVTVKMKSAGNVDSSKTPFELVIGEGDADLTLSAGGNVMVAEQAVDWEMMQEIDADTGADLNSLSTDIGDQLTQQIDAQMDLIERQIDTQIDQLTATLGASGLSREAAERISQRAREASARATARAQEKMQRAQEKIQRKVEAAQRRAESRARSAERRAHRHERQSWGFSWPDPPAPPEPPEPQVTDDERLMILRMLADKKITAEEAEALLDALEGK